MDREDVAAWLRLLHTPGVGAESTRRLLQTFGMPQQVLAQSAANLQKVLSVKQATALLNEDAHITSLVETTWQWLQQQSDGVQRRLLVLGSSDYPAALLHIPDPPVLLYATGQIDRWLAAQQPCIAVVGSRNPTPQGDSNARQFCKNLVDGGWVVVSGMALGIDGAAHAGALQAVSRSENGISTIAVVGTGLDRVYPKQHRDLAHSIAQHGVLLSEQALGTPPLAHHFPKRNRIIAGLAYGVLVVEAALQSGSLITARLAAEQGKEVFAIPGSIHAPQVRGCHALIKQGAKLVESVQDIVEELHPLLPASTLHVQTAQTGVDPCCQESTDCDDKADADKVNVALMQALGHDPVSIDVLLDRTGLDTATLQAELLMLELSGVAGRLPGGLFQRVAGKG